jgi:acetoin utilization deacetylase AcuC-like enzyme
MKIFYSPSYTVGAHSFETTRKSRWIAESLAREPLGSIELVAPESTNAAALSRVHEPEYVDAVRNGKPRELAESQGFPWDSALGWTHSRDVQSAGCMASRKRFSVTAS